MTDAGPMTFAKVLQLLADRQQSGILEVSGPEGEMQIHLMDGKVCDLEMQDHSTWKLGDFLVESETIAENELVVAHEKARRENRLLEEQLVRLGMISEDILKRFVELHVRETILPLFAKAGIVCHLNKSVPKQNKWVSPIPVPWLLKTAARRTEAWPHLQMRIPDENIVFDKVDAAMPTLLAEQGAGTAGADGKLAKIGANERVVYYYVNGKKTVRQLAYASCLGEFETYVSLCHLFDGGFIAVTDAHGKGEALKPKRVLLPATFRLIAYTLSAAILVGLAVLRPGALADLGALVAVIPPRRAELHRNVARARVTRTLDHYLYLNGDYPETLSRVLDAHLLSEADLRLAYGEVDPRYRRLPAPTRNFTITAD